MTVDEKLIDKFLSFKQVNQGRSEQTVLAYRLRLVELANYLNSRGKSILSVESDDLIFFCGLHLHTKGVAPRSRRPAVAATRGLYGWLFKNGLTKGNLAQRVEYPRISRKLPYALSLQHAEDLLMQPDLSTLKGCRDFAILSLLFGVGLRVGGVVKLNTEDLMLNHIIDGKELSCVRVSMKGGDERILPLPMETLLSLRIYLGQLKLHDIERTLPDGNTVLFVNIRNGKTTSDQHYGEKRRLRTTSIRRMLKQYGEQAKIPEKYLHPHALRHLFGTELAEAEIDIHVRKELMGHSSLESTLLYDRMSIRRLAKASNKANPFSKIKNPMSELANTIRKRGINGGT